MMRLSRLAKERKQQKLEDGRLQELFEQSVAFRAGIRATIIQKNVLVHLCWTPKHVGFLTIEETAQTIMVCRRWWQTYYDAQNVHGPLAKGRYFNRPKADNLTYWQMYFTNKDVVCNVDTIKGSITVSTSSTTEFEFVAKNNQWRFAVLGNPTRYVYYKSSGEFKDALEQWLPTAEFRKHQDQLKQLQRKQTSYDEVILAEKRRLHDLNKKTIQQSLSNMHEDWFRGGGKRNDEDSDLKEAIRRSLLQE